MLVRCPALKNTLQKIGSTICMTHLSEPMLQALDKPPAHPKYRPDIDGLRAIAVISVVVFHAFPSLMKGGFVGVDVFFVISGFLISSIIFGNLERGSFSFLDFYSRRVNRIFPALLLMLAATWAFGWFSLMIDEYSQLGKHIAGGSVFISNFVLLGESGYFDNSADTKVLLHLWSLGIEEQFYLVWPLMVWVAWKLRLNVLVLILVVGGASFAMNAMQVVSDQVSAFYSPQTRFWELLVGSLLAYIMMTPSKAIHWRAEESGPFLRNLISLIGVVLLVAAFALTTKDNQFPGWWAVLPTVGAALVIAAGPFAWINKRLLSSKIMVWFGLISFPLYLWHWPLLSFVHIREGSTASPITLALSVALSVFLAWMTYRFVERPLRTGGYSKAKTITLTSLMMLAGLTGYVTHMADGFKSRMNDRAEFAEYFENSLPDRKYFERLDLRTNYRGACSFYDLNQYLKGHATSVPLPQISSECYTRQSPISKTLFIWGDSHAQQLYSGLNKELPKNWEILQVASSGCSPSPYSDQASDTNYCLHSNWFALKQIKSIVPDVVIVGQSEGHDTAAMLHMLKILSDAGVKRVIFTGPTPHWTIDLPKTIMRSLWVNTPRYTLVGLNQAVIERNDQLKKGLENSGAVYADIISVFCNDDGCLTYVGDDIKTGITSWDYGHLTPIASEYLARKLLVDLVTNKHLTSVQ